MWIKACEGGCGATLEAVTLETLEAEAERLGWQKPEGRDCCPECVRRGIPQAIRQLRRRQERSLQARQPVHTLPPLLTRQRGTK